MSLSIDLSGSTALVTGSSQGIGAAIARTLHLSGVRVVVNDPDNAGGNVANDAKMLVEELRARRPDGSIVCVGSLSAKMGFHGQSNYSAAKAGVQALVRVLSRECANRSIRVNAVAPGAIDTAMVATVKEAAREQLMKAIALKRLGRPEEVATAVLFLCSPLAS
jgi:NAD(P)-dependent dehydrogenase (short-subunit alcohol dehydrogenase family)